MLARLCEVLSGLWNTRARNTAVPLNAASAAEASANLGTSSLDLQSTLRALVDDDPVIDRSFLLLAAGKHALDGAREDELAAILQLLDAERIRHEEQVAETQDDLSGQTADTIRALICRIERAAVARRRACDVDDAGVLASLMNAGGAPASAEVERRDAVPWRIFYPQSLPSAAPAIRLDVSHQIPGRRHADYYINEVMVRVERELGRALIWRPIDDSTDLFTRIHVEIRAVDGAAHDIDFGQEELARTWQKCQRELLRELALAMIGYGAQW